MTHFYYEINVLREVNEEKKIFPFFFAIFKKKSKSSAVTKSFLSLKLILFFFKKLFFTTDAEVERQLPNSSKYL